jgi:hypothetical protein
MLQKTTPNEMILTLMSLVSVQKGSRVHAGLVRNSPLAARQE